MNPRLLLALGLAWFGVALLWFIFGRGSFTIWLGHGRAAKVAALALAYALQLFIFGWVLPIAIATYLLVREH